jgi:hypothetical protein
MSYNAVQGSCFFKVPIDPPEHCDRMPEACFDLVQVNRFLLHGGAQTVHLYVEYVSHMTILTFLGVTDTLEKSRI